MLPIYLDKEKLTVDNLVAIAREGTAVAISEAGAERVLRTGALVDRWVKENLVKGPMPPTASSGAMCLTWRRIAIYTGISKPWYR